MADTVEMVVETLTDGLSVRTKTNKETYRFDANIGGIISSVTVWGEDCAKLGGGIKAGDTFTGKFARKSDYNGKPQYWATPIAVGGAPAAVSAAVSPAPAVAQQAPPPQTAQDAAAQAAQAVQGSVPPPPAFSPVDGAAQQAPEIPGYRPTKSYAANCMDYPQTLRFIGVTYSKLLELVYIAMGSTASLETAGTVAQALTSTIYIGWQHGHVRVKEQKEEASQVDVKDLIAEITKGMKT